MKKVIGIIFIFLLVLGAIFVYFRNTRSYRDASIQNKNPEEKRLEVLQAADAQESIEKQMLRENALKQIATTSAQTGEIRNSYLRIR